MARSNRKPRNNRIWLVIACAFLQIFFSREAQASWLSDRFKHANKLSVQRIGAQISKSVRDISKTTQQIYRGAVNSIIKAEREIGRGLKASAFCISHLKKCDSPRIWDTLLGLKSAISLVFNPEAFVVEVVSTSVATNLADEVLPARVDRITATVLEIKMEDGPKDLFEGVKSIVSSPHLQSVDISSVADLDLLKKLMIARLANGAESSPATRLSDMKEFSDRMLELDPSNKEAINLALTAHFLEWKASKQTELKPEFQRTLEMHERTNADPLRLSEIQLNIALEQKDWALMQTILSEAGADPCKMGRKTDKSCYHKFRHLLLLSSNLF